MKGLFSILIGLFVLIGCSNDDKKDDTPQTSLMNMFDISPNDTSGLKIFGLAQIKKDRNYILEDTIALLGNKNGKLWVQILKCNRNDVIYDGNYKRINNFTINNEFSDEFKIDLGYGEEKVIKLNYWTDVFTTEMNYMLIFHDQENFAISTNLVGELYPSWIIYNNTLSPSRLKYNRIIASGYWGHDLENIYARGYVCNEKGEPLYYYPYQEDWNNIVFINLYEYISYYPYYVTCINAETGKVIWETQLEKMGQVIDGHEPKIEHSIKIVGEYVECLFNITNYDGSKKTQIYNVDIETGEITEL